MAQLGAGLIAAHAAAPAIRWLCGPRAIVRRPVGTKAHDLTVAHSQPASEGAGWLDIKIDRI
jgi:hypothetical protein